MTVQTRVIRREYRFDGEIWALVEMPSAATTIPTWDWVFMGFWK